MSECSTCPLSAVCIDEGTPQELGLVQCNYCKTYYVNATEPDGEIRLKPMPRKWKCPIPHQTEMVDGEDAESYLMFARCGMCGERTIGVVCFLSAKTPPV